ncbi:MAG: SCO family protein [Polyangiaceae bacterium]|nr:SCO family protein [Polyangiaceae bacterium]
MTIRIFCLSALLLLGMNGCRSTKDQQTKQSPATKMSSPAASLPELSPVGEFQFLDQQGRAITQASLQGSPYVAAFFFTRCPSVCPRLMAAMKDLRQKATEAGSPIRTVSISVDPENDTPEVLQAYMKKQGLSEGSSPHEWLLLTGDFQNIAQVAEENFKVGLSGQFDARKPDLGITHGSHLVLVDRNGKIRGYYRSTDAKRRAELIADLKKL